MIATMVVCFVSREKNPVSYQSAFVGGGRYVRVNNVATFDLGDLRVFDRQNALRIKHFLVSNKNAVPRPNGLEPDSDGENNTTLRRRFASPAPSRNF